MSNPFPLGLKRAATLCILKHNDKFLLLKRAKEPHKGLYTPVGGKIDPYERPKTAAIRETFEETGIQLDNMEYCGVLTESSPVSYNWICYAYLAEIPMMEPPPCNEGELSWVSFEEMEDLPSPMTDWFIYKYVMEGKTFAFDAVYDQDLSMLELKEEIRGIVVYKKAPE